MNATIDSRRARNRLAAVAASDMLQDYTNKTLDVKTGRDTVRTKERIIVREINVKRR